MIFFSLKQEIEEILFNIRDIVHVVSKISNNKIIISIPLDNYVSDISNQIESEYGHMYRPVLNSDEIISNIISLYNRINDLEGIEIEKVDVTWINAGEHTLKPKMKHIGSGPGSFNKTFTKTGIMGRIEGTEKGSYSLDILSDFLEKKGNRVRVVKMHFDIIS